MNTVAHAAAVNFRDWQKFGDVASPSAGQTNLSTDARLRDDSPASSGAFNYSGTPAGQAAPFPDLQDFLGVNSNALDNGGFAFEGSAIKTIVTAQAGDVLNFNYNFRTNELRSNDFAFLLLNGNITKLADVSNTSNSPGTFGKQTGVNSYNYTFTTPGNYTLALGVVDVDDYNNTSALEVSSANTNAKPVPEPLTILGSLTALGFGVSMRRKWSKKFSASSRTHYLGQN